MNYVRESDKEIISLYAIRDLLPNMSIPDGADLRDVGFFKLFPTDAPDYDPDTQEVKNAAPVRDGDVYQQGWSVSLLTPAQIAANQEAKAIGDREAAKAIRAATVDRIKVTTQSGKVFDGDEISQGRMARGILGLQAAGAPSVLWVLADNTPTQVTVEELGEALALAGAAQAAAWVI